jgi:inhibitor of cysteine peptidase
MARALVFSLAFFFFGCDSVSDGASTGQARNSLPRVGEQFEGGTVTEVRATDEYCYTVTVERAAPWACSPAQIEEAERPPPKPPVFEWPPADEALELTVSDCTALAALRRPALESELRAKLASQRQALLPNCLPTSIEFYVGETGRIKPSCDERPGARDAATDTSLADAGTNMRPHSLPITPVGGADEPDFVKQGDGVVYVLSRTGSLHVVDVSPAPESHEIAQVGLFGSPTRMLLAGDRLVVYTRTANGRSPRDEPCSYGDYCGTQAELGGTALQVFDVSTPASPRELVRYELSGGYAASRRVGDIVYTVTMDQELGQAPDVDLQLRANDAAQLEAEYASKLQQLDTLVDGLANEHFLPHLRTTVEGGQNSLLACEGGLVARGTSGASITSLIALDLRALGTPRRTLIAAAQGFVHISERALYLTRDLAIELLPLPRDGILEHSGIHKFTLDGLATPYVSSASIPGRFRDQYTMVERDTVLRAATEGTSLGERSPTGIFVNLAEQNGTLALAGQLTGFGPEASIRSAQFDGDRAYLLIGGRDPRLLAVDPAAPRILGELKLPGYVFVQPMNATHVLAIGFDFDDQGNIDSERGARLRIFDMSNPGNATLLHESWLASFGYNFNGSIDHLAFHYVAARGLLALPRKHCSEISDFSGLTLLDVSVEQGIHERGSMPFAEAAGVSGTCSTWAFDSISSVKRSLLVDDSVIGLSYEQLQVSALSDLGVVLQTIPLD